MVLAAFGAATAVVSVAAIGARAGLTPAIAAAATVKRLFLLSLVATGGERAGLRSRATPVADTGGCFPLDVASLSSELQVAAVLVVRSAEPPLAAAVTGDLPRGAVEDCLLPCAGDDRCSSPRHENALKRRVEGIGWA